jgi:acid phosphatase class B
VGHQVTGADYLGRGSLNTNAFQLTKTADTLQITVGDIISDANGGATSTVITVSSDADYTYVNTGGLAYNAVLPLTFTSTDYVSGGNIWKRVAWSADTW